MTTTHPAKWSQPVLDAIGTMASSGTFLGAMVLDPFCGVGTERLRRAIAAPVGSVIGVDLEAEWVEACPGQIQANALCLPFADGTFKFAITSCVYGNRMSDHHNAQERCKVCSATGTTPDGFDCVTCGGTGRRKYKRITYRHQLGRPLHRDNAGQMQWGPKYRAFHEQAWAEVLRVIRLPHASRFGYRRLVLNVSDHERKQALQPVTSWHIDTLRSLGCGVPEVIARVETPRMKFGANREARAIHESVLSFPV